MRGVFKKTLLRNTSRLHVSIPAAPAPNAPAMEDAWPEELGKSMTPLASITLEYEPSFAGCGTRSTRRGTRGTCALMAPVRTDVTCAPLAPGPARHLGYLHAVKRLLDGGHLGPNADGGTDFCAQVVLLHSTVDAVA